MFRKYVKNAEKVLFYTRKSSEIRPHNPEAVGSSPASATKIIQDFDKKSGIFRTFYANLRWLQICFGDSLGIAQNQG